MAGLYYPEWPTVTDQQTKINDRFRRRAELLQQVDSGLWDFGIDGQASDPYSHLDFLKT